MTTPPGSLEMPLCRGEASLEVEILDGEDALGLMEEPHAEAVSAAATTNRQAGPRGLASERRHWRIGIASARVYPSSSRSGDIPEREHWRTRGDQVWL